jgi:hypothetical protein
MDNSKAGTAFRSSWPIHVYASSMHVTGFGPFPVKRALMILLLLELECMGPARGSTGPFYDAQVSRCRATTRGFSKVSEVLEQPTRDVT